MPTFRDFLRVADVTRRDKTSGKRMKEIRAILKKHSAFSGLTPEKATMILEDLGPTYVKMGQIASNRSDILPKEYCGAFEQLRANVPPVPFDTIVAIIEQVYQKPWSKAFSIIEETPLGSASIAQVHKAVLLDGSAVAVKVRRPGIVLTMAEDIMLMKHILALAQFTTTSRDGLVFSIESLVSELERTTADELDFSIERENLERFCDELQGQKGISSPLPFPAFSTPEILVMEFVTGTFIDDMKALRAAGYNLDELGERLAQSYVTQIIDNGFFHADPHPGNILVDDGSIIWIDLGMTGSLTATERALVGKIFRAVAAQDPYELKEALLALSKERGAVDHGLLLEQMGDLLSSYSSVDLSDINIGMAFLDVIEILRSQSLSLPPSFTMLARGLLTLEGVLSDLSPSISLVDIVSKHVERQVLDPSFLASKGKELLTATAHSAEAATKIPAQLSHTLEMLDRGELKLHADMEVAEDVLASVYSASSRVALAMISAGLFIGSSVLCMTELQPQFLGVPLLGFLGYVGAFVLGVYVIMQTLITRHRERTNKRLD